MPLTFAQSSERYILNSIKDYLNTNIVVPYNTAVASTSYPNPLGIELERPADPMTVPVFPLIVIRKLMSGRGDEPTGIGEGLVWKTKDFRFSFYPALTTQGKPEPEAEEILRHYADWALGTALFIPVYDYSQNQPYPIVENIRVSNAKPVIPTHMPDIIMDYERYRFDYVFTGTYATLTING